MNLPPRSTTRALAFAVLLLLPDRATPAEPLAFRVLRELPLTLEGSQQGLASDGEFLYVVETHRIHKLGLDGTRVGSSAELALHHGGATIAEGKLFVAVSGCEAEGSEVHRIEAYDPDTLALAESHDVAPHFTVCAGGIAYREGRFYLAESFYDDEHPDRIVVFERERDGESDDESDGSSKGPLRHLTTHELAVKSPHGLQGLEYLPETDQFQLHSHGRDFYRVDARFENESIVRGEAPFALQDLARLPDGTLVLNRRDRGILVFVEPGLEGGRSRPIVCEGSYGGHLQGLATDGESIYWSHTVSLVKTDLTGRVLRQVEVPNHHGDLTVHGGRVYVAVELGEFNQAWEPSKPSRSKPWVYVYSASELELLATHRLPELVHGCGGIAHHAGRFLLVGGLPADKTENPVFEYDEHFRFRKRHVLASGPTRLGIQTAARVGEEWWFGCYGSPENAGLLRADDGVKLIAKEATDFSYGIAPFEPRDASQREAFGTGILRGGVFAKGRRGKAVLDSRSEPTRKPRVRLLTYNVLFGNWVEPEELGRFLAPYELDVVALNEVPGGDWTARVGRVAGLRHHFLGKISSANHKDKYKSLLSRTPLTRPHEIEVPSKGWSPASLVGAETTVGGIPLLIYSTHLPGRPQFTTEAEGSAVAYLAEKIVPGIEAENLIILGDFNQQVDDAPFELLEKAGLVPIWRDLKIDPRRLSSHKHIESGRESGVIDHLVYREASGMRVIEGGVIQRAFNPRRARKAMERYLEEWEEYGKPMSDHRPVWAVVEFANSE